MPIHSRRDEADFRTVGERGTLAMLRATFTRQRFAPHSHPTYAIGAVERGATVFDRVGRRWVAPAGTLILINPGEVHTGAAAHRSGWTYTMFYVAPSVLAGITAMAGRLPHFPRAVVPDRQAAGELLEAGAQLREGASSVDAVQETIRRIAARHAEPAPDEQAARGSVAVRAAVERIERCRGRDIAIHQLAAEVGLSVFHFIRVFRQATGLTPYAFIQQERLRLAQELMAERSSLAEIALLTGFADQSHFTRVFKRRVGATPGVFMRGLTPSGGMARSA